MPEDAPRGETLAERIKRLRRERSMTQDDFVRQSGLSRSQLLLVESGKSTYLRPDTLAKYADTFEVPAQYIRDGTWPRTGDDSDDEPIEVYLRRSGDIRDEDIPIISSIVEAYRRSARLERLAQMTPEERRDYWQYMTAEERDLYRKDQEGTGDSA